MEKLKDKYKDEPDLNFEDYSKNFHLPRARSDSSSSESSVKPTV